MALFKCKMCGGALEIRDGESTGVCEYCGSRQTLPNLADDRRANLYDRANHFRRSNEYDKAMALYERLLNEDSTDAEAYWSLVLCRYGIEYVEDPATHIHKPTVNRTQYTSIFDDQDYKAALKHADDSQRRIYEAEAKAINALQREILAISRKEEPFDVFLCYKETDRNGRRTPDSVLAGELYQLLTREGFKVFFSRITLEDKLGEAYEPYIFAALNSAKVMVVLGTRPEYFRSVWVRNEWSRYLALIKNDGKKLLIPAYRDMDPYDLPEEFSHLQAQDMGKLGFMQDLTRGIQKIIGTAQKQAPDREPAAAAESRGSTAPLLKRAFMFLDDEEWASANEYCEKVLDMDPEEPQAYLGKLMAEFHVRHREELKELPKPFDESSNYKKVLRFADDPLRDTLSGYVNHIHTRNEKARVEGIYYRAKREMDAAAAEADFCEAASAFESVSGYKDAAALARECRNLAERARKDAILNDARARMAQEQIAQCEAAIALLESIPGWKDSEALLAACRSRLEMLSQKHREACLEQARRAEDTRRKKKTRKICGILFLILAIALLFASIIGIQIYTNSPEYKAKQQIKEGFAHYQNREFAKAFNVWATVGKEPAEETLPPMPSTDAPATPAGYIPTNEELLEYGEALFYDYAGYISRHSFREAIPLYELIPDYKDAADISRTMQQMLDTFAGEYVCISHDAWYEGSRGEKRELEPEALEENITVDDFRYADKELHHISPDYYFLGTHWYPSGEYYTLRSDGSLVLWALDHPWECEFTFSADGTAFTSLTTFDGDSGGELLYWAVWKKAS